MPPTIRTPATTKPAITQRGKDSLGTVALARWGAGARVLAFGRAVVVDECVVTGGAAGAVAVVAVLVVAVVREFVEGVRRFAAGGGGGAGAAGAVVTSVVVGSVVTVMSVVVSVSVDSPGEAAGARVPTANPRAAITVPTAR
jgi:hypothetical protein